jgi:hypothetical protein
MISRRRLLQISTASTFATGLAGHAARAQTQGWPNRHVRLVVPFPAGGGADAIARIVAARLSEMWGQQVLIENRGGASGNLAAESVAKSPPDGYTMFLAGDRRNLFLYPKLSYDPVADFLPVSLVVLYPSVMVVPNSSPAHSLGEFIAHAKANKGKLSFASPGHGTVSHLAGELLKRAAGIEFTTVPYRGAAPAIQDLIPGRVDLFFNNISAAVADAAGPAAGDRRDDHQAIAGGAAGADLCGVGPARLRRVGMVRPVRAGQDPARDRAENVCRHRHRAGRAHDKAAAGRPRPVRGRLDARGARPVP